MQTTDQWGSLLPKGLGNDQEATQATSAMRQSPWYQDWAKKNGLQFEGDSYGNAKLNDNQQQDLYNQALKNGIGLNNKYDQIDENGQISEAHHKLRNGLIAAAIAGAGLTGFGAAGIGPLSGLFGGASAAAGAGTGAGVGLGETAATGIGGLSATSLGLPVTAGLGTAGGAAAAGGAGAALSTIPDLGAVAPEGLPGYVSAEGVFNSMPGAVAGPGVAGMSSGPGSLLSRFTSGLKDPGNLADLSRIIQQGATDAQGNRVIQGNFANQYDQNMLKAQTDRNATESDALKKLAQTHYILGGGSHFNPGTVQMNGQQRALPTFGLGPTAPSDAQKQGATDLQAQLTKRLAPGGTYTPMPFSNYGTPGTGEQIGNYAGQGLGIAGTIMNMFGKK